MPRRETRQNSAEGTIPRDLQTYVQPRHTGSYHILIVFGLWWSPFDIHVQRWVTRYLYVLSWAKEAIHYDMNNTLCRRIRVENLEFWFLGVILGEKSEMFGAEWREIKQLWEKKMYFDITEWWLVFSCRLPNMAFPLVLRWLSPGSLWRSISQSFWPHIILCLYWWGPCRRRLRPRS